MKGNPVNWFEIPVVNMERGISFYGAVFKVELQRSQMNDFQMAFFPMAQNSYGAGGMLIQGESYVPSGEGVVIYFSVANIESTLVHVEQNGGRTLFPKKSIGEYGFIAHFQDCEGNRIGLHSME